MLKALNPDKVRFIALLAKTARHTAFLQWALPQLNLRWPGFRKVHRQVCRRLKRRMNDLRIPDLAAYRTRLEADPAEWRFLDECCHITISRFFREKRVFKVLRTKVLPHIAERAHREVRAARIWLAGCASGEEPYTLKILWDLEVTRRYPSGVPLSIIATDTDRAMLARADQACFPSRSLRELPTPLLNQALDREDSLHCLKRQYREGIEFLQQDLRLGARLFPLAPGWKRPFQAQVSWPRCSAHPLQG
jgi:chemotaxis protein methyltransferase CheR